MGVVRFSEAEQVWILEYRNSLNCPFCREREIGAGTRECIDCPAFISVDRDRNLHTTLLKCGGNRLKPRRRVFREK
ncbi:MAG: hypothetical protein LBP27_07685 [Treponema sp.]|jgi:hypothetical protein|nr:hypothetical protein [Treponema sp.]